MPEPASAFSVRRESNSAVKLVCASTSAGMPSRPTVWSSSGLHRSRLDHAVGDRQRPEPSRAAARAGRTAVTPPVDRGRELRRPGRRAEQVDHVDDRLRLRVDEVERLAVAVGQVREVVHRLGDVVDRHHVGVAEVDADQRQPGGQPVAQPLHHREEVVGAVDLVHRAGLAVADHDRRAVDPPRARSPPRGRSSRTRTSSGGTARAGAGPRRTSSRRTGRGTRPPPPPTTPGGSSRPRARRRARARGGCRRRSSCSLVSSSAVMS